MTTVNPRNNRLMPPKYVFIEGEHEALICYEDFGTNWVLCKQTGEHKVCTSSQFAKAYDRIAATK